ncbi:hypothetical protein PENTCL1PPCAC_9911, partial [Pristionchus entomophagus]
NKLSIYIAEWSAKRCSGQSPYMTELFVRPISPYMWNITLQYTQKGVNIAFGGSLLTIKPNEKAKFGISVQ